MSQVRFPLKKTQRLLLRLVTAPEGVKKALEDSPVAIPLQGDRRLSAVERLDIYADMYFFRILESLKEDFPAVLKILGENSFHNLITDYLIRYPPTHWSLRYAGQKLPAFLKNHPTKVRRPYLHDLARLELALLEAFDAPDTPILTSEKLSRIEVDRWDELRFKLAASARLIAFQWKVDRIREGFLTGRRLRRVRSPTHLLIWRREGKVFYRRTANLEKKILMGLGKIRFGKICGMAAKEVGKKRAAPLITHYLHLWLKEGLLRDP